MFFAVAWYRQRLTRRTFVLEGARAVRAVEESVMAKTFGGKVVLVTGANSGIGESIAVAIYCFTPVAYHQLRTAW